MMEQTLQWEQKTNQGVVNIGARVIFFLNFVHDLLAL